MFQRKQYTLNIGLDRNDGGATNNPDAILAKLRYQLGRHAVKLHEIKTVEHAKGAESTLIVGVYTDLAFTLAIWTEQACLEWAQDCIAVYDHHACHGKLVGPMAAEWGPFNLAYFHFAKGDWTK
ncbi:hypothetical protein Axy23_003 [Achromobacter phage vB_AxyP_19-32_Axy23]|uniref:Uncharacterized protein n=1 Tax=Achromobacter phage vB_AxyP_19-32_Axy23 TaxID=2591047 RepID=A0A514CW42_9CAUD|nr:hypothetical protein Axy23_003 [Achromobacter phage vB_AxyP_19-32_Axy23]